MDPRDKQSRAILEEVESHPSNAQEIGDDRIEEIEMERPAHPRAAHPAVPPIESLGIDPNGPRLCYMFPAKGDITVIPWNGSMKETFPWVDTESKILGSTRVEPYGKLRFTLCFDENGMPGNNNQHLGILPGDAFLVSHFEPDDHFQDLDVWWATYREGTHYGYPIPAISMPMILKNLHFIVRTLFNPFQKIHNSFCSSIMKEIPDLFGSRESATRLKERMARLIITCIEEFRHPDTERVSLGRIANTMRIVKSWEALKAFTDALTHDYYRMLRANTHLLVDGQRKSIHYVFTPRQIDELRQMRLPHAEIKLNQIGKVLTPAFVQMQKKFLNKQKKFLNKQKKFLNKQMKPDKIAFLKILAEYKEKPETRSMIERMLAAEDAGVPVEIRELFEAAFSKEVCPPQDEAHPPQDEAPPPQDEAHPPQDEAHPPQDEAHPPQDEAHPPQDEAHPPQDEAPPPKDTPTRTGMTAHERAYWLNYEAEQAEVRAKEAKRKLRAAEERERRAAQGDAYVYRPALPQVSKKSAKKAARQQRTQKQRKQQTQSELTHEVHSLPETHALAQARFAAKQAWEHAERLAEEARERAKRAIQLEKDMSVAKEAATHCVPPAPTVGDALCKALDKAGL